MPGGLAIVPLKTASAQPPEVFYRKNRVLVKRVGQQWYAVVGIPLSAKPGKHTIRHIKANKNSTISFNVRAKHYPEQRLQCFQSEL